MIQSEKGDGINARIAPGVSRDELIPAVHLQLLRCVAIPCKPLYCGEIEVMRMQHLCQSLFFKNPGVLVFAVVDHGHDEYGVIGAAVMV